VLLGAVDDAHADLVATPSVVVDEQGPGQIPVAGRGRVT